MLTRHICKQGMEHQPLPPASPTDRTGYFTSSSPSLPPETLPHGQLPPFFLPLYPCRDWRGGIFGENGYTCIFFRSPGEVDCRHLSVEVGVLCLAFGCKPSAPSGQRSGPITGLLVVTVMPPETYFRAEGHAPELLSLVSTSFSSVILRELTSAADSCSAQGHGPV